MTTASDAAMLATSTAASISGQGGARHKDQKRGTDHSVQNTHHTNSSSEPF
jgi:hypothetical protein